MTPCSFDGSNRVLDKPADMTDDQCTPLSVWSGFNADGTPVVVSCWKLTQEEVEHVIQGGRIWLTVYGQTMPPVALQTESPFEEEKRNRKWTCEFCEFTGEIGKFLVIDGRVSCWADACVVKALDDARPDAESEEP